MPVANTFSNISKRGFGGFLPTSTNGVWVPASSFSPGAGTVGYFTGCALTAEGARQFALPAHSTISSSLIYRSTDFGTTFTGLNVGGSEWSRVACNYNGQYVLATRFNNVFVSQDFGESYTNRWAPGGADFNLKRVAVGYSGQVMMACHSEYWLLSTNYGTSFTQLSIPLFSARAIAIAGNADILYAAGPYNSVSSRIYRSTDGGGSWTMIYEQGTVPSFYDLAVSDDGVNITAIFEAETLVSSNSGTDFVFRLALSNPGGGGNSHAIAMSGSGLRQLIGVSPFLGYPDNPSYSGVWMSADGGLNWTFENLILRWIGQVGVSKDGRVQMVAGRTQSMGPLPWPASMLYINVQ